MDGFQLGLNAETIFDNPFWIEYPKPSKKGPEDERQARAFVDGHVEKLIREREALCGIAKENSK